MSQLDAGQTTDLLTGAGAGKWEIGMCSLGQGGLKCGTTTDSPGKPVENTDS